MTLQWPVAEDAGAERVWRQVLVPIAAEMRAAAAELSAQSVARMRAELPQLLPDEQMVTEHLVSTEAGLRQLAQVIEAGADPRRVELPHRFGEPAESPQQQNTRHRHRSS